jgi:hypothetical protein
VASVRVGDLTTCLLGKLQAVERTDGPHLRFAIYDDAGQRVATTHVSHGWRANTQLSDRMTATIRRQLRLATDSELVELIACSLSRADYLGSVR